ncbi:MAG: hypothetical protein IPL46_08075 [Saprospiraceae bacterium]|nr:hypothetical protein [Saprospiraceae bacterium]
MTRIKHAIDLNILKHYALATTALFVLLATYAIFLIIQYGFLESMHLTQVQKLSTIVFLLVLGSSLAGAIFHHLVNYRPRSRNAFAFVFSVSTLKFLGTLLAFQILGF